jgi:hypothetical protein
LAQLEVSSKQLGGIPNCQTNGGNMKTEYKDKQLNTWVATDDEVKHGGREWKVNDTRHAGERWTAGKEGNMAHIHRDMIFICKRVLLLGATPVEHCFDEDKGWTVIGCGDDCTADHLAHVCIACVRDQMNTMQFALIQPMIKQAVKTNAEAATAGK